MQLHRNAQRLLRPIPVVNNHMHDDRDFPDYMTRTRRDHMKLLTLIETIALLHQHQREIKTDTRDGETLEYIEATERRREAGARTGAPGAGAIARRAASRRHGAAGAESRRWCRPSVSACRSRVTSTVSHGARCGSTRAGATRSCG